MNFKLMGVVGSSMIRWIYNAEREDFIELFGSDHLWRKYIDHYDRSEGDLICSMDLDNLEKLAQAAFEKEVPEILECEAKLKAAVASLQEEQT